MQYGGIDVGIASWRGVGSPEDLKIPTLLTQAEGTGFTWAFYYEAEGSGDPTDAQLQADIDYLVTTYGNYEAVAKIDGRIVIFVYSADDDCEVVERWNRANTANAYLVM
jgi:hypothetical protein